MFAKVMAVVMAAILIATVGLSAVWWFTLRNQQIDARLDYLISEAEDIAYLAAEYSDDQSGNFWYRLTVRIVMNEKMRKVNREFGAFIAVLNPNGGRMDNLITDREA